jgi:hypothetical protein
MAIIGKDWTKRLINYVLSGAMMSCLVWCKYPHTTWRPHWTCLYCRVRRWHYGKLDRKLWRYNRYMRIVIPLVAKKGIDNKVAWGIPEPDVFWLNEDRSYLLFRDPRRRFLAVKEVLFNALAAQCRRMEVKPGKIYSRGFLFVRKNFYTLLEMLAN